VIGTGQITYSAFDVVGCRRACRSVKHRSQMIEMSHVMVERPVLHHQDDEVLDFLHDASLDCRR